MLRLYIHHWLKNYPSVLLAELIFMAYRSILSAAVYWETNTPLDATISDCFFTKALKNMRLMEA